MRAGIRRDGETDDTDEEFKNEGTLAKTLESFTIYSQRSFSLWEAATLFCNPVLCKQLLRRRCRMISFRGAIKGFLIFTFTATVLIEWFAV